MTQKEAIRIFEGNELVTNCHQLKMRAIDGNMRMTRNARVELEAKTGKSVVSSLNAKKGRMLETGREEGGRNE